MSTITTGDGVSTTEAIDDEKGLRSVETLGGARIRTHSGPHLGGWAVQAILCSLVGVVTGVLALLTSGGTAWLPVAFLVIVNVTNAWVAWRWH